MSPEIVKVAACDEDDAEALDFLALELHMSRAKSISVFAKPALADLDECGGCGAPLSGLHTDLEGRIVHDFDCGHRYRVGNRVVTIERRF